MRDVGNAIQKSIDNSENFLYANLGFLLFNFVCLDLSCVFLLLFFSPVCLSWGILPSLSPIFSLSLLSLLSSADLMGEP